MALNPFFIGNPGSVFHLGDEPPYHNEDRGFRYNDLMDAQRMAMARGMAAAEQRQMAPMPKSEDNKLLLLIEDGE